MSSTSPFFNCHVPPCSMSLSHVHLLALPHTCTCTYVLSLSMHNTTHMAITEIIHGLPFTLFLLSFTGCGLPGLEACVGIGIEIVNASPDWIGAGAEK